MFNELEIDLHCHGKPLHADNRDSVAAPISRNTHVAGFGMVLDADGTNLIARPFYAWLRRWSGQRNHRL